MSENMGKFSTMFFDCIVIGGGISGVSCVETISALQPGLRICLISASPVVKITSSFRQVTKTIEEFDVEEKHISWITDRCPGLTVIQAEVVKIDPSSHKVVLSNGDICGYRFLCVCSGGKPKLIANNNPFVLGIRDTETVREFQLRLQNARRVVIVGNGGIATELAAELHSVIVVWAIKDSSISACFFDPGAAEFLLDSWKSRKQLPVEGEATPSKRLKYTVDSSKAPTSIHGSALGPDWAKDILLCGKADQQSPLTSEYSCGVQEILTPDDVSEKGDADNWPVYVRLTNGKLYGCDFIVSATGVIPNLECFGALLTNGMVAADGGINVNEKMETGLPDVYAAGDVCTADWKPAPHWFQMRLWTQARQMGVHAARCICSRIEAEDISNDFAFELFAHTTKFFGFKVILLGLYNGQKLGSDFEVLLRVTRGQEFVKVIVKDGKMQGAILIGETDLEETFENLILNGTDISQYGEDLLNPDVDIEDYFD